MLAASIKPNRAKLFAALLLGIAVVIALVLGTQGEGQGTRAAHAKAEELLGGENSQRIAFLQSFGWSVEEEPCEIRELLIPAEFGDVYEEYEKLQKEQGLSLKEYRGCLVKRYTYVVKNHPMELEYARANLLVYEEKIIGGDICSLRMDGFMHGFALPEE